jgi:hypothetical protein
MKVQNYNIVPPSINDTVFGTANGDTANFNVQSLLALNSVPLINSAPTLIAATISSTNTYFTSATPGAVFAITMPTASSSINGAKYVIMSTVTRPATTWITPGATGILGIPPAILTADTPICLQYDNATTAWYISM